MNILEKILEDIEEKFKTADAEKCDCEELCDVEDWYDSGYIDGQLSAHEKCMDIIRSHMDDITDDGWIPVEEGFPEDCEEMVLVQVSGKVTENIWFDNAFELAAYVNGGGLDFRELSGMEKSEGNSMAATSRTIPTKGEKQ